MKRFSLNAYAISKNGSRRSISISLLSEQLLLQFCACPWTVSSHQGAPWENMVEKKKLAASGKEAFSVSAADFRMKPSFSVL